MPFQMIVTIIIIIIIGKNMILVPQVWLKFGNDPGWNLITDWSLHFQNHCF